MPHNRLARLLPTIVYSTLLFVGSGCQGHNHDHETNRPQTQALALHDSLVAIEADVRATMDALREEANPPSALNDSLNVIAADLLTWEQFVVEPEGAHDEHGHDHTHDHSHMPPANVTPEQMVEVQQALLNVIRALHHRLLALTA
ncbi:MAG: hypothetical protein RhofKO_31270 [Rhodothermales bacterium]